MRFASAIQPELLPYLSRLSKDRGLSAAEITRRVGERARVLGLHRPSYAGVRLLVQDARIKPEEPSWGTLALEVATRQRHPEVLIDKYVGLVNKHLPEDAGIRERKRS